MAQQDYKIELEFKRKTANLTICFYENPAAKQELVFWEGLIKDKIQSKSYINDIWSYHLKDGEGHELVVCIPIDLTEEFRDVSNVSRIVDNECDMHQVPGKLKYYKTLIFGKVQSDQLKFISIMMELMERGKWK